MNHFDTLYKEAFAISEDIILSWYASVGGVSAALITKDGNIFTGKCLDFSASVGFCAEHSAIAEMLKTDHSGISEIIAVRDTGEVVAPCGRCREMMMQIHQNNKNTLVYIWKNDMLPLSDLLPHYWK